MVDVEQAPAVEQAASGRRVRFVRPDTGTSRHGTWGALVAAVLLGLTLVLASSRGSLQHSSLLVMAIDRGSAAVNSTGAALLGLADSLAAKAAAARAAAAASAAGGSKPHATAADRAEAERGEIPDGPEVQGLPCQESGYCSVGKLRPYVGRMDTTEEFQAMLKAGCYKKECIFVTIGSGGHLLGLNLVSSAWRLGLANILFHAKTNESCAVLAKAGYTNVTCVWSEFDWFPHKNHQYGVHEAEEVWLLRYLFVSRAVWQGYNVLLLDTDSWLYRDPYLYLNRPPFDNISFIGMQEGGGTIINGGSFYIRGSLVPGGPAAVMLASAVDHMLRMNEGWLEYHKAFNVSIEGLGGFTMDQWVLSNQIASQWLGYPTVVITLGDSSIIDKEKHAKHLQYQRRIPLKYPPELHNITGVEEELVGGHNMSILYQNGSWPTDSAGPLLPRANYSEHYVKMLEKEGGYPFPDISGPPPPGYVPRNETLIFSPPWLLSYWLEHGIKGWWEIEPLPPQGMLTVTKHPCAGCVWVVVLHGCAVRRTLHCMPSQTSDNHVAFFVWAVMIHAVYIPGPIHPPFKKEYILKASNAFDYNLPLGLNGKLIPASTPEQPLPRVLALPPGTHVEAASWEEYRNKTGQLVRLAMRLNRVALMPEPVCLQESWISTPGSFQTNPGPIDRFTGTVHNRSSIHIGRMLMYGLDADYHCVPWFQVEPYCHAGAFTVHADFKAIVKRLPAGAGSPGPDNTLQIAAGAPLQSVLEAAKQKDAPHVLFLSAVPDLANPLPDGQPGEDDRYNKWLAEQCGWMRPNSEMPRLDRRRLGEQRHGRGQQQQQGRSSLHAMRSEERWDV